MTIGASRFLAVAILTSIAGLELSAQEQVNPPAQPQSEMQVAQDFKKAAPTLFREWLERRPEMQKRMAVGHRQKFGAGCYSSGSYYEFRECVDARIPTEYKVDVTKTDSVLTPFVGHLYVPVKETCTVKNAVPEGVTWSEAKLAILDPSCLGKMYEECIAAGAKPAPKKLGSACTGGPGFSFPFEGEVHLTFRWSDGKWEFEGEKADKPVPPQRGSQI